MAKQKRYMVIARTTNRQRDGMSTGKGKKSFRGKSAMYIKDPAEAREIEQVYGKKGDHSVHVFEDDRVGRFVTNERGEIHNYFFGGGSRKYVENYDRIFRRKKK